MGQTIASWQSAPFPPSSHALCTPTHPKFPLFPSPLNACHAGYKLLYIAVAGGSDVYAVLVCGNDAHSQVNAAVFERDLYGMKSVLTDPRVVGIRYGKKNPPYTSIIVCCNIFSQ